MGYPYLLVPGPFPGGTPSPVTGPVQSTVLGPSWKDPYCDNYSLACVSECRKFPKRFNI